MPEREDALIAKIAGRLRAEGGVGPGFDARVMAHIESLPRHRPRGLAGSAVRWLLRPRDLRLSPLTALAAAAALAAIAFGVAQLATPAVQSTGAAVAPARDGVLLARNAAGGRALVQFVLFLPDARSVTVVGDFNDWDPAATPLTASRPGGLWVVSVPLTPGRHHYAFVVDGTRWIADPAAPPARDEDFGSPNSVVTVGA